MSISNQKLLYTTIYKMTWALQKEFVMILSAIFSRSWTYDVNVSFYCKHFYQPWNWVGYLDLEIDSVGSWVDPKYIYVCTYDQNNNIPATVPCAKWNTLSLAFLPFFLLKVIIENIAKSFNVYRKERLLQLAIFIRKTVVSLCNNITIFNKFVKLKCE